MKQINWVNTLFLIITPLIVIAFVPLHVSLEGIQGSLLILLAISCLLPSISITGGYHRLFSHNSYQANNITKFLYLVFGAAALQGSALKWSSDHRRHHRHVDTEEDPYNAKKGFWYAHMGWVFFKDNPKYENQMAPDLKADPLVMWQHKYYVLIAVVVGFMIPTYIGWYLGYSWGGLLWGGFARIVVTHHCTFFINSLCHMWGNQPYADKNSAKDNFLLAFLTYGEGFHNFHHRFANDYRNGIRWYHWDPTKWAIRLLSFFGFTWDLQKTSDFEIFKAKLKMQEQRLKLKGKYDSQVIHLRSRIEDAYKRMELFKSRYRELKQDFSDQRAVRLAQIQSDMRQAKSEFRYALAQWKMILNRN